MFTSFYAVGDGLDQILGAAGSVLGYDIIIFQKMVGCFQIITEVLDTRSREESFNSLIYNK